MAQVRMKAAAAVLMLALVAMLAGAGVRQGWWTVPDRHNPWARLNVNDPPGWLTRFKLGRLDERPADCLVVLAGAAVDASPLPDADIGAGCAVRNAVRVRSAGVRFNAPFTLSCRAAVSLVLWERHVLQPEAEALFGRPLQQIDHLGSLACRNIDGRAADSSGGRRSQHASADALDVAAFVLQGGRRIAVAGSWDRGGNDAAFLSAARDGACSFFDGVLGPDYNRAHADHFHLDRGPYRICR